MLPAGSPPVVFDHDADGTKTGTGWLKGDDAWLALDRNGNGSIDSGRELFGVDTQITKSGQAYDPDGQLQPWTATVNASSGFEALASLDSNADGVFDAADAAFTQVRLWQDLNGDGISQANELSTLAQKGITSISLSADKTTQDLGNGNSITGKAVVTRSNGSTGAIAAVALSGTAANLNLANNPFYRQFPDKIALTEQAKSLPEMGGSGWTRDLREAMSLGNGAANTLAAGVQQFAQGSSRAQQMALVDDLLTQWAASTGHYEANQFPERRRVTHIQVGQTHADGDDNIVPTRWVIADPGEGFFSRGGIGAAYDYATFVLPAKYYQPVAHPDPYGPYTELTDEGQRILQSMQLLEIFNGRRVLDTTMDMRYRGVHMGGGSGGGGGTGAPEAAIQEVFRVTYTQEQVDAFQGSYSSLADSVYGTLVMQTRLRPYLDAVNLVIDEQGIRFDSSASLAMLQTLKTTDPAAAFADLADMVRFGYGTFSRTGVDTLATLNQWATELPPNSPLLSTLAALNVHVGASTTATNGSDIYLGDAAANSYNGGAGQDQIHGGAGADSLSGGDDNDVLDGGAGNDALTGGAGSDTYVWGLGSGKDFINNNDSSAGRVDTLQIKEGLSPSQLSLVREDWDLLVSSKISADQVRISQFFLADHGLDQFAFADGTVWNAAKLAELVQQATAGNDLIEYGGSDDVFSGGDGNDTLVGGLGNDTLEGNYGDDVYVFSQGSGKDVVYDWNITNTGTDTIRFTDVASTAVTALERRGYDLVLKYGATDQITVQSYFQGNGSNGGLVEQIQFTDATWDWAAVTAQMLTPGGTGNDNLYGFNGTTNRILGYDGNDTLSGGNQADILEGGLGDDDISGNAGADMLLAGDGNDNLSGGEDNDTLIGGLGNDTLIGDYGDDVYVFSQGSGKDVVYDWNITNTGTDTIRFTDVASTAVTALERRGYDLVLKYGATDQITVQSYFQGNGSNGGLVEQIQFTDATWDWAAVTARVLTPGGTGNDNLYGFNGTTNRILGYDGNDTLSGGNQADTLDGGAGDDSISGNAGDDMLLAGDGNDTLSGGDGNDTLVGGLGNDTLEGDYGDDVYVFSQGSGKDVVYDWNITSTGTDTIRFTDVASTAVTALERRGYDLVLKYGATDQITVQSYFQGNGSNGGLVEQIQFTDATWDWAAVTAQMLTPGGTGNDNLYGFNGTTNRILGYDGNDTLSGGNQADTLDGGAGDDDISGNAGADMLLAGDGNDNLSGGEDNDTLIGGLGNDTLAGDYGDDVYVFSQGSGKDVVYDWNITSTGTDTIRFTDVASTAVTALERRGYDLVLKYGATDQITVQSYFQGNGSNGGLVEQIQFTDVTWDWAAVSARVVTAGTAGADYMAGANGVSNRLAGYDGNDTLNGGDLADALAGGLGDDSLVGNAGDDTLDGGAGNDNLIGGAGDDTYIVDATTDVITENSGEGTDTVMTSVTLPNLAANVENLTLTGTAALNATGNALNNVLTGNSGANRIDGGAGVDTMIGSAGNDTYVVDNVGDVITELAAGGTDGVEASVSYTLGVEVENLTLTGTAAIDGTGNGLANNLTGNSGANRLDGGAGNDTMVGGAGNDTYVVDSLSDVVTEAASGGTDTIESSITLTLVAEVENLTLTGTANINATGNSVANTLRGNAGNNTLDGGAGNDTMLGGAGDDTYVVDATTDVVTENVGEGTDTIMTSVTLASLAANVENLTLTGTSGLNATGNTSNNVLTGNSGANRIDGGAGVDTMIGGAGNDTYVVDSASDVITELAGGGTDAVEASVSYTLGAEIENLTLTGTNAIDGIGNGLANSLTGNSGANRLDGGAGNDTMVGGAGNDIYVVDSTADVVTEAASGGTDTIETSITLATLAAEVENLTLTGTANINATGNSVANTLRGNAGNNTLDGGAGNDTMLGGAGDDTYVVDATTDVVTENAGEGTDTIMTSVTLTSLAANVENLTLTGTSGLNATGNTSNNVLTGNSGANRIDGGAGVDTMIGGAGNDTYVVDSASDVITELASGGTDAVEAGVSYTLGAEVENLTLTGTAAIDGTGNGLANNLTGNSGANRLDGGAGNDTMVGGAGNDTYVVDSTADVVTEAASGGTDTIETSITLATLAAEVENLTLTGAANVNATGNSVANTLRGNSGDNVLTGGAGNDTMIGGAGNDTYVLDVATDVVTENAGEGTDTIQIGVTLTTLAANVENLTLTGTSAINGTGNALDNVLTGNSGANNLSGGAGNDTLDGGVGNDTMVGGAGNDTFIVDATTDVVTEVAGEGTDTIKTSVTLSTLVANVENLTLTGTANLNATGNTLDNVLTGNSGANNLSGGAGNDTLDGGAGNDTMVGGAGNDTFYVDATTDVVTENASEGTDTIMASVTLASLAANVENLTLTGTANLNATGNTLDNVLTGNAGNNTLTGNAGNDTLDGKAGNDTLNGGAGADTYWFGQGYGSDLIIDSDATANVKDVVRFTAGIAQTDIKFTQSGNALVATIKSTNEALTIQDWYLSANNRVEEFRFNDGTVLTNVQAQALVGAMAAFNPSGPGMAMVSESEPHLLKHTGFAVAGTI